MKKTLKMSKFEREKKTQNKNKPAVTLFMNESEEYFFSKKILFHHFLFQNFKKFLFKKFTI